MWHVRESTELQEARKLSLVSTSALTGKSFDPFTTGMNLFYDHQRIVKEQYNCIHIYDNFQ